MTYACEMPSTGVAADIAAQITSTVPQLATTRLTLRAPCVEDFAVYAEIVCTDRGIYVGGPYSREDGWFDFIQLSSNWMLHGHGGWAVETKAGELLGFVIIGLEPGDQEPELGFLFTAKAEGQGIAAEAATAALDFAANTLKRDTLVSYIDPANERSIALAKRLGGMPDGTVQEDGALTLIYRYTLSATVHQETLP
ncbi:MAG: GNAT family N-acetyltransferase [Cognatishimia sp.]